MARIYTDLVTWLKGFFYTESEVDNFLSEKQDTLVSGSSIKTINNQTILGSGNLEIQSGGSGGDNLVNVGDYYFDSSTEDLVLEVDDDSFIVTSWDSTLSDVKVPSEKLAKNTIDAKQDTLVSGTNLKTINNESLLGQGNITIQGGSSVDIVTAWESTPSDSKVASEKLVKDTLDTKIAKSNTSGLVKNDGTVDTTSYSTFTGSYNDLSNKPTIPSASSTTPSADTTSGSYGSGTSYARSNHTHPKSSLYAESSHTHTKSQITDFPSLSTVATSGSYSDLSNKPSIPSSSSDLSDGSSLVKTSSTTGLLKNDGSVDTTSYSTFSGSYSDLSNKPSIPSSSSDLSDGSDLIKKSNTSGLIKNDGSIDTSSYITSSSLPTKTSELTNDGSSSSDSLVYVETSSTSGLLKNDGSVDTNTYLTSSALTDYVQKSIRIDNGANLNDIDVTGFYYCSYNVIGTNISNAPNNMQSAFCLLVEDMGDNVTTKKKQTFTTTSDGKTWIRTKTGGSWQSWKQLSTFSGSYDDLSNKPTIPSKISDLTNDSDFIETSSTTGLIKNDGSIDTNTYITSSSLPTKTSELTNDGSSSSDSLVYVETSATSGLLKNDGTVDTTSYLSSLPSHNHDDRYYTESEMDTALSNKISKSGASGLVRNDGTIDASNYITSSALSGYQTTGNLVTSFSSTTSDSKYPSEKLTKTELDKKISTSSTSGLVRNDGSIDTSSYITSSSITGMLTSSDIADNLTTNDSTKVLSAKQGKALNDMIGSAISYIVGSGS